MYKANKKNSLLWLVFILLLALSVGCAKKDNQFDTPEKVAAIFWTAIKNSDAETATAQVYELSRPHLGKMISRDIREGTVPLLPTELKFEVNENGDAAFALVLNSDGVGCDLIKFEGRWWVR